MVTDPKHPRKPSMACWWARTIVESTDTSQSMSPAASFSARTARGIRENVAVETFRQRGEVPRQTSRPGAGWAAGAGRTGTRRLLRTPRLPPPPLASGRGWAWGAGYPLPPGAGCGVRVKVPSPLHGYEPSKFDTAGCQGLPECRPTSGRVCCTSLTTSLSTSRAGGLGWGMLMTADRGGNYAA